MTEPFTPNMLQKLDAERFAHYRENLDFYKGTHWQKRGKHRQLVFNYAKVAIDKLTSFLMTGLNFACDPVDQTDEAKQTAQRAEQVIYRVYDDNNLEQIDYETEIDTAVLGDGCYKVTWDIEQKRIRVTTPDVTGLYAWHLGDDPLTVWRVAAKYELQQDAVEILYKRKVSKKKVWMTEMWTAKQFELWLEQERIQHKPNPYGFIPFVIFPNVRQPKEFWGVSDIPPLIESQRELNRALSQLSRILEVSGNPIAVLEGVESAEDIKVEPGAVWTIPEEAKAYLLDLLQGGGIRLHVDYIDLIYRCLHDISEAPRAAYGGIERELSGVALEVELTSLLQKVRRKRTIRTNAYKKRNQMILKLHNKFNNEDLTDVQHRIVWGAVLPQDRAREAQNEQLLVQSGVHSRRTAMDEMGIRDPEAEFDKWLQERARILEMNQDYKSRSTRGGERERSFAPEMESIPE